MSPVHYTTTDGIGWLELDYPPLNILTRAALRELRGALEALAGEPSLRTLVLTARGKHFSAGADVAEHLPPACAALIPEFLETVSALDGFPLPTVAAVHGKCLGGGCELVLGADLVLAAADAVFGQPEIMLGVLAPAACALLPHRVPRGVVAEMLFTGDPLPAAAAAAAGLVHRVVPRADLEREALALAGRIARHSGAALRLTKRAVRGSTSDASSDAMDAARTTYLDELMATADATEGLTAFVEKRPPVWSDA